MTVQHLVGSLRALGEPPARGQPPRIDDLEARLLTAVERDLVGSAVPDGYPGGVLADGNRGGGPTTSVEAAVVARADQRRGRDIHHELTMRAVEAIEDAVVGIQIAFGALASIDDLTRSEAPGPRTPKRTCHHCTGKRGKGADRPVYATGTVGDRLERAVALCQACHGFVCQTAPAGSRAGYLPSDGQIADHEARGRWRIRVPGRTPNPKP